ncbi:WapI family immunity protein [Larkinella rosea]|uniref:Uncharacterized protein n=1 Tax=Larkinella rosea TaxID=2025312 RepID=A0A3P1C7V2_9BACT|nr:hypothetical protein [Larkinella rosea]RRB09382.1 hypothetical protein EHT25_00005 [Larkinella rosea]
MNFSINGYNGFIKVEISEVFGYPNRTSHLGGYETKSQLSIRSGGFSFEGKIWPSTGQIFQFYQNLQKTYSCLQGETIFHCEFDPLFTLTYDSNGHLFIKGKFTERTEEWNLLEFEIRSDQSYLVHTMAELKQIVMKYGDDEGNIPPEPKEVC